MYITGGVVKKDNPIYIESSRDFNLAFKKFPLVIVFCFSEDDIVNALKYAVSNEIPFRIRSGRHDYEGNSNVNKGMVIDISNINYTFIDEINNKAKLGAGITSGKMYSDLVNKGYTIPAGTCNDVGFCGLTTCGGVGFAARLLGLSCDNLLEIELINYEGKKIVANEYCNENLFWAVRGGLASSFGIVVSLTYKITPVCNVSTYVITWNSKYFIDVLDTWQSFTPSADVRLSTSVSFEKEPSGNILLSSSGQFFGGKEELELLIEPLINAAPTESIEIETISYKQALEKWSSGCPNPRKFKGTGSFIFTPLNKCILKCLEDKLISAPKDSTQFYEFIGLNGNVSQIKPNETAFVHRNSLYLIEIESVWDLEIYRDDNIAWTNSVKELLDTVGKGTYRGFTDFDIKNWQEQYYGDNYLRLRDVKSEYDPLNIFNFPQSIEPL
ncbi:FAD-binding oxidoreductase [Wukongibacter baidiensis]|uniref:FAD-binding oxidoreductase n=1 Tax=Wukongibacter baidiensis TaxID=1723361 RepID=UPI003D7FC506